MNSDITIKNNEVENECMSSFLNYTDLKILADLYMPITLKFISIAVIYNAKIYTVSYKKSQDTIIICSFSTGHNACYDEINDKLLTKLTNYK